MPTAPGGMTATAISSNESRRYFQGVGLAIRGRNQFPRALEWPQFLSHLWIQHSAVVKLLCQSVTKQLHHEPCSYNFESRMNRKGWLK